MTDTVNTKKNTKVKFSRVFKDLVILVVVNIIVFILSYFFNVFAFLIELFQRHPQAMTWIDEIITSLLTLSIGFAIFAWRRMMELKKETAECIRLQEELTKTAETKAEVTRIINKELRSEIEYHRQKSK